MEVCGSKRIGKLSGLSKFYNRLVGSARLGEGDTQIVARRGIAGVEADCGAEFIESPREVVLVEVSGTLSLVPSRGVRVSGLCECEPAVCHSDGGQHDELTHPVQRKHQRKLERSLLQ